MTSIETLKSDIENDIEWKEFLRNQYNLFYDSRFLNYHKHFGKDFIWHHLKFKDSKNGKILAVLIGNETVTSGDKNYISCDGVSFGGFLWKKKANVIDYISVLNSFNKYLEQNNFNKSLIRAFPFLYHKNANEETEYAFTQTGYKEIKNSITNIIDIAAFDFKNISETKKRVIRRSQANIEIKQLEGELNPENFSEVYNVLLNDRQLKGVKPTHTMEELIYLKNELNSQIFIFYAVQNEKIIAICILFEINKEIILNFYLATVNEIEDEGVSDLILYRTIDWSKKEGYKLYDIGTSDVEGKLSEGLFSFKKRFLANGYLRKTFEKRFNEA